MKYVVIGSLGLFIGLNNGLVILRHQNIIYTIADL